MENALHVAPRLGIDIFLRKNNLVYKTILGEGAIVNPETVIDWKSEELPKIIDVYQPKDIFNIDETGLFYNFQPSKTLTMCAIGSPYRGKKRKNLALYGPVCAHPRDTNVVKSIIVIFSPTNCTSHLQPLDMGIIHALNSSTESNLCGRQQQ
jgi:hypothetical protein